MSRIIKKIVSFIAIGAVILSLSACSLISDFKEQLEDAMQEVQTTTEATEEEVTETLPEETEETEGTEENTDATIPSNEDEIVIPSDVITDEDFEKYEEAKKTSIFATSYQSFEMDVNGKNGEYDYLAMPMTYTVFDGDDDGIETLSELPETVGPGEIVTLSAKFLGQPVTTKMLNYYYDEDISGDEAVLCYYEGKILEGCEYVFPCGLTQDSTKSEFLEAYGEYDYGNASLTEDIVCYYVPGNDIYRYKAFAELTFNIETQKVVSYRVGIFAPEYLQLKSE